MRARRPSRATLLRVLALGALLGGGAPEVAGAHAGLAVADPAAGVTVPAATTAVRLTFSERPEASLSEIEVLGPDGRSRTSGPVAAVPGEPLALAVGLAPLDRGIYTVRYRSVSAIDGHATTGAYAFGVGVSAAGAVAPAATASSVSSGLEVVARWALLAGLGLLLGGAVAVAAGLATDLTIAVAGLVVAALGLGLLVDAQRRTAGVGLGDLLDTSLGSALMWRAAALAAAAGGLLLAHTVRPGRPRSLALAGASAATVAAIAGHVAAGHAAAGGWAAGVTVTAQVVHVAAAGIWLGGLTTLLGGLRGAPAAERSAALGRFARVAVAGLVLVLITGTLRAVDELGSVGDLADTGYGRAVVAKVVLFTLVAVLGWRRRHGAELALAAGALVAAALLGTLAPPAPATAAPAETAALTAEATADGVAVRIEAAAAVPGPNRFRVRVEGGGADGVRLRFVPLEDRGVAPTTLVLQGGDETFTGAGPNLAFEGRWGVTAEVDRDGERTDVPLELLVPSPESPLSLTRVEGQPTYFAKAVGDVGFLQISLDPERAGRTEILAGGYDPIHDPEPVRELVLTMAAGDDPPQSLPMRRRSRGIFGVTTEVPAGPVHFALVVRVRGGLRMRSEFDVDVPG
ncbi:MAG: copper resistance protein CopC [Solirubrobacteraceae bacterium]